MFMNESVTKRIRSAAAKRRRRRLRLECLQGRLLMAGDLTNEVNPLDVNGDDQVSAGDALLVINHLQRSAHAEGEQASLYYLDVNGDESVTAGDALMVINGIARAQSDPSPPLGVDVENGTPDEVMHSGNVEVKRYGKDVHLNFTGDDGDFVVTMPEPGILEIDRFRDFEPIPEFDSLAEGEQIAEEQFPYRVPLGDDLFIKMYGAGTIVELSGVDVPDDLIVDAKAEDTIFLVYGTRVHDDFIYRGSEGNDVVDIDAIDETDETGSEFGDVVNIRTKGGDDEVYVYHTRVRNDFFADLGSGNDSIEFWRAELGDDGKVLAGSGDDFLLHYQLRVHDDYIVHGQDGDDGLFAEEIEVGDDALLFLQDGNDEIGLNFIRVGDVGEINGGDDYDTLLADEDTMEVRKPRIRNIEETLPVPSF